MKLLLSLFLSMSFTLISTPLLITKLKSKGIVDKPDTRRVNKEIVPRMGGVVILFSLLIILFSFFPNLAVTRGFLYGLMIISLCGIIDDIVGFKWSYKFLFQFITSIIVIFSLNFQSLGVNIFYIKFPNLIGQLILVLFIIGLINSINLMDGLDGLVAGFSVEMFIPLALFSFLQNNQLLNIILFSVLGSLIGFLKYNAHPAKIFLGDTGSLILGYLLTYSVLAVSPISQGKYLDLSFAIILLSVPIIDTLRVLIIRIIKQSNPFKPDKLHLHHILLNQNIHHKKVVFFIQFYSLIYILDLFVYLKYSQFIGILLWIISSVFLLNLKSIVIFLQKSYLIQFINKIINNVFLKFTAKYKKYLILFSFLPLFYLIVYFLINIRTLNITLIFFVGFVIFVSLATAFYNKRKPYFNNNFYIYINFFMFFVLALHSKNNFDFLHPTNEIIFYSSVYLILIISLFLLFRKSVLKVNGLFFNGFDLFIIILTSSIFLIDKFINVNDYKYLLPCFIYSLLFYLWNKILVEIYPKLKTFFFYFSFFPPLIAVFFAVL